MSNLDTVHFTKHLYRKEYIINLMEPFTAEAHGVQYFYTHIKINLTWFPFK